MQATKYLLLSGLCFCPSGSINFTLSKYCGGSWFLLEELVGWEVGCNLLEISSSVANSHLALSIKYCTICVFWTRLCWRFSPLSFDRRRLGAQQMARFLLLIPGKKVIIHDIFKSAISYWFAKLIDQTYQFLHISQILFASATLDVSELCKEPCVIHLKLVWNRVKHPWSQN